VAKGAHSAINHVAEWLLPAPNGVREATTGCSFGQTSFRRSTTVESIALRRRRQ
jgi:hypothetical protein